MQCFSVLPVVLGFPLLLLNTMTKEQVGEETFYLAYASSLQSIIGGSYDRNLEEGAHAKAMEECCLLAGFPWFAQPAFL